jgi:hypothetical protein
MKKPKLEDDQLVKRVDELLGSNPKSIIEACGYTRRKKLLVEDFYSNLIAALSLNDLDI